MWEVFNFIGTNWTGITNLLLVIVGLSAVWLYKRQKKDELRNAASLIIMQVDELQVRVREIQTYITKQGLNSTAFYESLSLMESNYWDEYKHLFIRKMDNKSFDALNRFYQYISCIQEQQELMKSLQKNYFYVKQNSICNAEFSYIMETIREMNNATNPIQFQQCNVDMYWGQFWAIYSKKRNDLRSITDADSLTPYTPEQIATTIQAMLNQYALLEIVGTPGYNMLRSLAKMT